jgi:hypothetical protein
MTETDQARPLVTLIITTPAAIGWIGTQPTYIPNSLRYCAVRFA